MGGPVKGPTTILTHGDLDGMVSAILVLQAVRGRTCISITNRKHLPRCLAEQCRSEHPPTAVFVTDVPLRSDRAENVADSIEHLASNGAAIHIFDHHHGWEAPGQRERIARSCSSFRIDTNKTTAAALVWRHWLRGDPNSRQWLRLLSEKDTSDDPWIVERFGLLVALMQRENWPRTEETLQALARGEELRPEQKELANWYYREHVPRVRSLAENAEILTTRGGRRLAWLDLREEKGPMNVAPHVVRTHGVELVATVIRGAILLGGRSIDRGVDLTFLHGRHEVGGIHVTIAGHKSPVRIEPVDRICGDDFIQATQGFLLERL